MTQPNQRVSDAEIHDLIQTYHGVPITFDRVPFMAIVRDLWDARRALAKLQAELEPHPSHSFPPQLP